MAVFETVVGRLRAVAEPTRLRVLALLRAGEFNVTDLTHLLGQSQPRVSRHVKLLADAGLIERYQEGSFVFVRGSGDASVQEFVSRALAMLDDGEAPIARDAARANQIREERASRAQSYFDENAAHWDRIRSLHVAEREVEAAMAEMLGAGTFDLILDAGTGTGRLLELFAPVARRMIGIDTNREMLKCARVRIDSARLVNCSVRLADMYNMPFPDDEADAVIVHQVLHFLDSPKQALAEAVRVLKPGGKLLLVDFAPHDFEFLRGAHAHVRLGFSSTEVAGWLADAGMKHGGYRELTGTATDERGLTVAAWLAIKSNVSAVRTTRWKAAE